LSVVTIPRYVTA